MIFRSWIESTRWGFPKIVVPNKPIGFPTKNDDFGVFWGYHHLRKHPDRNPGDGDSWKSHRGSNTNWWSNGPCRPFPWHPGMPHCHTTGIQSNAFWKATFHVLRILEVLSHCCYNTRKGQSLRFNQGSIDLYLPTCQNNLIGASKWNGSLCLTVTQRGHGICSQWGHWL